MRPNPFVRAVMAVAHGAELNRRDAGPQKRDRVRGAVPADDAPRLAGAVLVAAAWRART